MSGPPTHRESVIREADDWLNGHRVSETWRTMNRVRDELARASDELAARPKIDRDVIIQALADHREGRWSDGTSSCRGCADRYEEEWASRFEETPEERRASYRRYMALSRPGWTSEQWREHVADALLTGSGGAS